MKIICCTNFCVRTAHQVVTFSIRKFPLVDQLWIMRIPVSDISFQKACSASAIFNKPRLYFNRTWVMWVQRLHKLDIFLYSFTDIFLAMSYGSCRSSFGFSPIVCQWFTFTKFSEHVQSYVILIRSRISNITIFSYFPNKVR